MSPLLNKVHRNARVTCGLHFLMFLPPEVLNRIRTASASSAQAGTIGQDEHLGSGFTGGGGGGGGGWKGERQ